MFLQIFLAVSIVFNAFMFTICGGTGLTNTLALVKFTFAIASGSAALLLMQQLGYIVKV